MAMAKTCYCVLPGLLLVPYLFTCLAMATTNVSTDQSALLSFKAHVIADPFSILANNWSIDTSACVWIGVSCDSHTQRVTALNISNMGLTGTIPPQLGNLSFLVSLDVRNNNFHGQLPEGMTRLRGLRYIYLSYNKFTGGIPSWFGVFPELHHLFLEGNSFTGFLPLPLFNLSKLEILDSSWNKLSGNIQREIGHLALLEELYLGNNNLIGTFTIVSFECQIQKFTRTAFSYIFLDQIGKKYNSLNPFCLQN